MPLHGQQSDPPKIIQEISKHLASHTPSPCWLPKLVKFRSLPVNMHPNNFQARGKSHPKPVLAAEVGKISFLAIRHASKHSPVNLPVPPKGGKQHRRPVLAAELEIFRSLPFRMHTNTYQ